MTLTREEALSLLEKSSSEDKKARLIFSFLYLVVAFGALVALVFGILAEDWWRIGPAIFAALWALYGFVNFLFKDIS